MIFDQADTTSVPNSVVDRLAAEDVVRGIKQPKHSASAVSSAVGSGPSLLRPASQVRRATSSRPRTGQCAWTSCAAPAMSTPPPLPRMTNACASSLSRPPRSPTSRARAWRTRSRSAPALADGRSPRSTRPQQWPQRPRPTPRRRTPRAPQLGAARSPQPRSAPARGAPHG
jgi:hypothetical protein